MLPEPSRTRGRVVVLKKIRTLNLRSGDGILQGVD